MLMEALVLDVDIMVLLELLLKLFDAADYEVLLEAATNDLADVLFLIISSLLLCKKL